ncbi:glycosyltransferase family 2 protein [Cytobacillus firmus]|uniref:glycosyltransferase family 2 protein n=1 Tax=Cytobacillus firmus TaxID=1399 RepID=UPI00218977CD|nr:glycosyltransferase family 2 protein [Cytobacillus firmus]URM33461.1 glycosyltransferase family 2 protein [Cytobacillus firmus]
MTNVKIVCITPVKNEEWLLDNFLEATSLWADHIIVADQNSTDRSKDIAAKYPKVTLIENNSKQFNEPERQKLLLEEARKIEGKKLIIALDADELLTPNWEEELETIKRLPEGTIIQFRWENIHPNLKQYWSPSTWMNFGYVDDGKEHIGSLIHSQRIPVYSISPRYQCNKVSVIHLQYIDWNRMTSKHRWYQCYETLNFTSKHPIEIFRMYHHMYSVREDLLEIPNYWVNKYEELGIRIFSYNKPEYYWWDVEVINYLNQYSSKRFSLLPIWDVNWDRMANFIGINTEHNLSDPRIPEEKELHTWLLDTQLYYNNKTIKEQDRENIKKFRTWWEDE